MTSIDDIITNSRNFFETRFEEPPVKSKIGNFFGAVEEDPIDIAEEFVRSCYAKAVEHNPDQNITAEHIAVEAEKSLKVHLNELAKVGTHYSASAIPEIYDVAAYPKIHVEGAPHGDRLIEYEDVAKSFTHACQYSLRQFERQRTEEIVATAKQAHSR